MYSTLENEPNMCFFANLSRNWSNKNFNDCINLGSKRTERITESNSWIY